MLNMVSVSMISGIIRVLCKYYNLNIDIPIIFCPSDAYIQAQPTLKIHKNPGLHLHIITIHQLSPAIAIQ